MHPRPYVTVSYAQSIDGRIATSTGDSQWIGGPESLRFAHELRRDNDAILVGIGTVLRDDPQLTCRIEGGKNPIRVVLDRSLRLPLDSKLVRTLDQAPVWVFVSDTCDESRLRALEGTGVRTFVARDVDELLVSLGREGIRTLFVEGGAAVITSFFRAKAVDRLVVVTAPIVLGKGVEAIGDLEVRTMDQALRPKEFKRWSLGADEAIELVFAPPLPEPYGLK